MQDYEQLGAFYLGKSIDPTSGTLTDDVVLYDAKDLTTHAVIVGMTGSGKTGLGIDLIEEAAIDGVPTLAIDPKGDLGNLLLTFPSLRAEDFRPWIDEAEAARAGKSPEDYAAATAAKWKEGLAAWGQPPERIGRLRAAAEAVVYTPGSTAGVPLTVLRSFEAPPEAVRDDPEALRERVVSTASSLLALLGIDADPVRSRDHILVANLLEAAWRGGRDLDLGGLIRQIQAPPFDRLGVFDLESFYPAKERFGLAAALNGLVASPGFSAWTQGEPLDVQRLLWTPEGRPRVSVISIAHLNDAERMFFVTSLLNEVVGWMRAQSGTSSLRALLYMDEIFGYFPPTANPPSKTPMLTLLKQARAYGLGVVLATQNPVDLDYKGLGNAGTWFLGRLQTERDKARVLDGLESASAAAGAFDRGRWDQVLSGLKSRRFLLVNAHDDGPTLFQTRWTLSYLRGPLTKPQLQALTKARPEVAGSAKRPAPRADEGASTPSAPRAAAAPSDPSRPVLPAPILERFFPAASGPAGLALEYRPTILGTAKLHYVDAKSSLDRWVEVGAWGAVPAEGAADPWQGAQVFEGAPVLESEPVPSASFAALPSIATREKTYAAWGKALEEWLYRTRPLESWRRRSTKETSRPGESEGDFRIRLAQSLREERDGQVEALRRKYAAKVTALEDRLRTAHDRLVRERQQASQAKMSTTISVGATILDAILGGGRRRAGTLGRATTAARGASRASKEAQDVARAEEGVETLQARLDELRAEIEAEVARLHASYAPETLELEAVRVAPRKGDLTAGPVQLVWTPYRLAPDGSASPAW